MLVNKLYNFVFIFLKFFHALLQFSMKFCKSHTEVFMIGFKVLQNNRTHSGPAFLTIEQRRIQNLVKYLTWGFWRK